VFKEDFFIYIVNLKTPLRQSAGSSPDIRIELVSMVKSEIINR
jgi:hypothetical protein